jgi:8-oxo-dGTP diphosphatase
MHRKEAAAADERIDLFFAATRWQGEPEIAEPGKCSELRWAALEHYDQHLVYAEYWPR